MKNGMAYIFVGILGSVMDIGHTTGPIISGIVAIHFGIERSFLLASLVIVFLILVFSLSILFHTRRKPLK